MAKNIRSVRLLPPLPFESPLGTVVKRKAPPIREVLLFGAEGGIRSQGAYENTSGILCFLRPLVGAALATVQVAIHYRFRSNPPLSAVVKQKAPPKGKCFCLAQREGFEPSCGFPQTDFESAPL